MRLLDIVNDNFQNQDIIFHNKKNNFKVSDLNNQFNENVSTLIRLSGKKIALNFENDFFLAKWMIFLDGIAGRITILPDQKNAINEEILVKSDTDFLLSDNDSNNQFGKIIDIRKLDKSTSKSSFSFTKTNWVICTSGTTGNPKLVLHDLKSLSNTTRKNETDQKFVWGLLYSLKRIAGIQVFLQVIFSGKSSLVIPSQESSLKSSLDDFYFHDVNSMSATPSMWRKILNDSNLKEN